MDRFLGNIAFFGNALLPIFFRYIGGMFAEQRDENASDKKNTKATCAATASKRT